jgi:hypothetical protein
MPNTYTFQVLKDDTQRAIIKITGSFDGSGQESNTARIQANTLYGALDANNVPLRSILSVSNTAKPYYGLTVHRVWYDCANNGDVELYWKADTKKTIFFLNGNGEYDGNGNWITIPNNTQGTANSTGDIGIVTRGMSANDSYVIVMDLRKENEYYQRGQFTDPAAFNYGAYGLTP